MANLAIDLAGGAAGGGSFNHRLDEALDAQGNSITNAGQIVPNVPDPLAYASDLAVSMAGSPYQRVAELEGNIQPVLEDVAPGRYVMLLLWQDETGGRELTGIDLPGEYELGMDDGQLSLQLNPAPGALTILHLVATQGVVRALVEHVAEPSFVVYDSGERVRTVAGETQRLALTVPNGTIIGQDDDGSQWLRGPAGSGPDANGWWRLGTGDAESDGFVGAASVDVVEDVPSLAATRGSVADVVRDTAGVYDVDFDHNVAFIDDEGIQVLSRYQATVYPQPDTITWDSYEQGPGRKLRMRLDFGSDPSRFDVTVKKIGDSGSVPAPTVAFVQPTDQDTVSTINPIIVEAEGALTVEVTFGGGSPVAVPHDTGNLYQLNEWPSGLSDGPLTLVATATGFGGQAQDTIDVTVAVPTFPPLAMQFPFNEAGEGTDPTHALNTGPLGSGSDMPILYESNAEYVTTPNGRGLEFGDSGGGRLHRQITTAERALIDGSTTWYFEYVFDFDPVFTGGGKHAIGVDLEGSGENHLGMRIAGDYFDGDEALVLLQMHHSSGQVGSGFLLGDGETLTGKWVFQGVIDTTQESEEDRFRVYARNASGWQQYPHQLGSYPSQNLEILEPAADRNIIIANIPLLHLDLGAEGVLMGAGMGPTIPADLEARSLALWNNDGALGGT